MSNFTLSPEFGDVDATPPNFPLVGSADTYSAAILDAAKTTEKFDSLAKITRSKGRKLQPIRKTSVDCNRNDPCPCGSGKKFKRCHGG